jgi:hypothetical protein
MDAHVSVVNCSWILAEMVRYSQRGTLKVQEAREIVESLVERKYPLIEEIDGRVYFHGGKKSAPAVALLALARRHPKRISVENLIAIIKRHGFTEPNARTAVKRIKKLVDDDGTDQLRLLAPGLQRADEILKSLGS